MKQSICTECGVSFEVKRSTAKFCGPVCRVTHSRKKTVSGPVVDESRQITIEETDEDIERAVAVRSFDTSPCTKHKGFKGTCGCK